MTRLFLAMFAISALCHSLALAPLIMIRGSGVTQTYDEGAGQDAFKIEQGLSIDAVSMGDASEKVEVAAVAPLQANATPPQVLDEKPLDPELKAVITAKDSVEEAAKVVEELPPPAKPQEVAMIDQAAQVERVTEKSAGVAQDGGRAEAKQAYIGQIHGALRKVKLTRFVKGSGKVSLNLRFDDQGHITSQEIYTSSGNAAIDRAAAEYLSRANFPPLPDHLSSEPFLITLTFGS